MVDEALARAREVLAPSALSVRRARTMVRELLDRARRPEWTEAAQLAVGELVTNAVLHAHTPVEVDMVVTSSVLRVEVGDRSPIMPTAREWGREASTGRGLALVASLTSEYGVRPVPPSGKVVWFQISDHAQREGGRPQAGPLRDGLPGQVGDPVLLCRFPPALWLAAREHHDALLRDFTLYRSTRPHETTVTNDEVVAADLARFTISAALDEVLRHGKPPPARLDLVIRVPAEHRSCFAALQDVLDEAERLAAAGDLLVPPALPEVVGLRDWACEQVIHQGGGGEPTPWPADGAWKFPEHTAPLGSLEGETPTQELRGIVVADDANRIVAFTPDLAQVLGWSASALAGRRLVTLIPPRLREAHVVGFTRYLATGKSSLLGSRVEVPVLHADGRELRARLRLDRLHVLGGRSMFVAEIDLLGSGAGLGDPTPGQERGGISQPADGQPPSC